MESLKIELIKYKKSHKELKHKLTKACEIIENERK